MKDLLLNKDSFENFKTCLSNPNAHPCSGPESYPCIIAWEKHDCEGYGGFYISYEYVYLTDFES
jgi:hypothetical protein